MEPYISQTRVNLEYAVWFDSLIDQYAKANTRRFQSETFFKRQNGFFITISFNQRSDQAKSEMDRFNDFYNSISLSLFGRNYHRQFHDSQRPLAIAGLDANGSRYWKSIGELRNMHVHSIWLLTNETVDQFRTLLFGEGKLDHLKERLGIRELDVQPLHHVRESHESVSRVSSYTAKFVAHNNRMLAIADDLRVYPKHKATINCRRTLDIGQWEAIAHADRQDIR